MPPKALSVLLLAGWAALPSLPSLPWKSHLPIGAERWLWNPRERTGQAIAAWNAEEPDPGAVLEATAAALRLAPDDPRVQYNAGTAELGAREVQRSLRLLEKAARDAPPDLAPAASYNLGNARLGAGNAAGAVEAYKQALRLAPDDAAAKHNLEIALRERDKGMLRQKPHREGTQDKDSDHSDSSPGSGSSAGPNQDPNDRRPSDFPNPGDDRQQRQQGQPQQAGPRPSQPGEQGQQPLPQFRNQSDMSAQEAAALLEAVDNLERQQRRKQAAARAKERGTGEKDW